MFFIKIFEIWDKRGNIWIYKNERDGKLIKI